MTFAYRHDMMVLSFSTKNGDTCLNWKTHGDSTFDHFDHNHCRNPARGEKEKVWCYTGTGNTWDYCKVPWCLPGMEESMNTTKAEEEGIPVIVTATIILGTVAFFLVIVICLIIGSWYCNRGEEKEDRMELVKPLVLLMLEANYQLNLLKHLNISHSTLLCH